MDILINFLLFVVAFTLAVLIFPIGFIVMLFNAAHERGPRAVLMYLSTAMLSVALAIDAMGNVVCRDLLNGTLRKYGGHNFGNYRETISLVLGKNKETQTLTKAGRFLAGLLNAIDPDHVERAARA